MKYLKGLLISLCIALLISVGLYRPSQATPTLPQNEMIQRSGVWLQNAAEASWFSFSGNLYYVYTNRDLAGDDDYMQIIEPTFTNGVITGQTVISTFGTGYGCQDAIVEGGTLYVFATSCRMDFTHKGNSVVMFSSTNLTTWSSPTTIYTINNMYQMYNTTVEYDGSNYIVGYDFQGPGYTGFYTGFEKSSNLSSWSATGGAVALGNPDLHYIDGAYYLTGTPLIQNGQYVSWMAKSTDLSTWVYSRITTMKPTFEFEDDNTTDMDWFNFGGTTYILYLTSDQLTYMRLTYATFNGSLEDFVNAYWTPN